MVTGPPAGTRHQNGAREPQNAILCMASIDKQNI